MRVSIPVSYTVKAIPFKRRLETQIGMRENVWVDVPAIPSDELDVAVVVRDRLGQEIERVYGYGGMLWTRDNRGDAETPFLQQHLDAVGLRHYASRNNRDYDQVVEGYVKALGAVGLLRVRTGGITPNVYHTERYRDEDGLKFAERTVESERARKVTASDRDEKVAVARRTAQDDTIAVGGNLYRRVFEPTIIAGGGYAAKVTWQFGSPNFADAGRERERYGYPVSVKDFDRIRDWFAREDGREPDVDFRMEVVDERYFTRRTDRIGLLTDAVRIVENELSKRASTDFIHKWCEVRDFLDAMWTESGERRSLGKVLALGEGVFERLAGFLEEVASLGKDIDTKGLAMWDSRMVSLAAEPPAARPTF